MLMLCNWLSAPTDMSIAGISFEADYTPQQQAAVRDLDRRTFGSPVNYVFIDNKAYAVPAPARHFPMPYCVVVGDGYLFRGMDTGTPQVFYRTVCGPEVPMPEGNNRLFVPSGPIFAERPPMFAEADVTNVTNADGTQTIMSSIPIVVQTVENGHVVDTRLASDYLQFLHSVVVVDGVAYGVRHSGMAQYLMDDRENVVDDDPLLEPYSYVYWSDAAQKLVLRGQSFVKTYRTLHTRFTWVAACVVSTQ
jgi:hypothetical protein